MKDLQSRIRALLTHLQAGIYEKEAEVALALLAALSGENVLLLGPPGVAKSMVARRMKGAFKQARSFEYLMSRFSTPDELFGPVSIARLKESDTYERATDGYLPTADVVFLDEIWKAGPAIQNTLLTAMNEKLFRNGEKEVHLPLKLLIAASNELPAKGEGLEALWDRFLIRLICRNIQSEDIFRQMLTDTSDICQQDEATEAITNEEYASWMSEAAQLNLSDPLLEAITYIRKRLQHVELENNDLTRSIYISDRRWKHIMNLLRTSAYLQGRTRADVEDLLPMHHCLWNEPEERSKVNDIVIEAIFTPTIQQIENLGQTIKTLLRTKRTENALKKSELENDHRDDELAVVDGLFYQIDNHGTGHTLIPITDYKRLASYVPGYKNADLAKRGVIYTDPSDPKRRIVRGYQNSKRDFSAIENGAEVITLSRGTGTIYLNGVRYSMRHKGAAVLNPATGKVEGSEMHSHFPMSSQPAQATGTPNEHDYETEIEQLCEALDSLRTRLDENLFASAEDRQLVSEHLQRHYKQIALMRADLCRLLYDEA